MKEDPIITAFKNHINQVVRDIDLNRETVVDEEYDNYKLLYHNKIVLDESNEPVGITQLEVINNMIKIKFRPLAQEVVINPLTLNDQVIDGSYYFLDQIPTE